MFLKVKFFSLMQSVSLSAYVSVNHIMCLSETLVGESEILVSDSETLLC